MSDPVRISAAQIMMPSIPDLGIRSRMFPLDSTGRRLQGNPPWSRSSRWVIERTWPSSPPSERRPRWVLAVRGRRLQGVTDVVLAYRSAAVFADPDRTSLEELERELGTIEPGLGPASRGKNSGNTGLL